MTVFNPGYRKGYMECACTLEIKAMIFFLLKWEDLVYSLSSRVQVFPMASILDRNLTKLLEIIYPLFLEPHAHPLGHGLCSKPLLIEIDRGLIPLEDGPIKSRTVLILCNLSQLSEESLANT